MVLSDRRLCAGGLFCCIGTMEGILLANTKSAVKRARQAEERRQRNVHVKSTVKGAVRDARVAATVAAENAQEKLRRASSMLDRAVSKGVMHRNTAARRKSRLSRLLAKSKEQDTEES